MASSEVSTLFVVTSAGSYPLLRYLVSRWVRAGRSCAVLYAGSTDDRFTKITRELTLLGVEARAFESYVHAAKGQLILRSWEPRRILLRWLVGLFGGADFTAHMQGIGRQIAAAEQALDHFKPGTVVVAENGISGPFLLLNAAEVRGIRCVTVPYGNCRVVDLEFDQTRKRGSGEQIIPTGMHRMLLRWLFPKWIKKGNHAGAVMFHPSYILALEAMGVTLRDPWICLGGPLDLLCAENALGYAQYREEKIPADKISLTGSPYCDEMVESVRGEPAAVSAFRQPRLINPSEVRILVSWPPDYHSTHVGQSEFASYEAMTSAYLGFLGSLGSCKVTVSLHPDAGEVGRKAIAQARLEVTQEHLVGLIPKYDLFVTFFSTAIRWAIAAAKPVVNIDLYRIEDDRFLQLEGVLHTKQFEEFRDAISAIVASPQRFQSLATQQIKLADVYGIVDGQCVDRIATESDRLRAAGVRALQSF